MTNLLKIFNTIKQYWVGLVAVLVGLVGFVLGIKGSGKPKISSMPNKKLEKALEEVQKNNEKNITDRLNHHFSGN